MTERGRSINNDNLTSYLARHDSYRKPASLKQRNGVLGPWSSLSLAELYLHTGQKRRGQRGGAGDWRVRAELIAQADVGGAAQPFQKVQGSVSEDDENIYRGPISGWSVGPSCEVARWLAGIAASPLPPADRTRQWQSAPSLHQCTPRGPPPAYRRALGGSCVRRGVCNCQVPALQYSFLTLEC